jgi:tRNA(adenine34) deaminase
VGTIGSFPAVDDHEAMGIALDEAKAAAEAGEIPVGAVALLDGEPIARAGNERERRQDPTAHAEILVLREASRELGSWRLSELTVVVTLEPCVMCAGALWAARVRRVVQGADNADNGGFGSLYNLAADPRLNHEIELVVRVRAAESKALLDGFFAERR